MFGGEGQARRQSNHHQSPRRRHLHITIEGVHRGEQEARQSGVGGHQRAVRQQVRIEHQQRERQKSRARAEHLLRRQKHQHRQQHRQQRRHHAGAKQHGVSVVLEQEVFSAEKCLVLEIPPLQLRDLQVHPQDRQRRQHLHHRRMLGVQPEVARLPRHVSRIKMIVLIPRDRFLPNRQRQLQNQNSKKTYDSGDDQGTAPYPTLSPKFLPETTHQYSRTRTASQRRDSGHIAVVESTASANCAETRAEEFCLCRAREPLQ